MKISRRIRRNAVSFFDGKLHACPTSTMIFLDALFISLYDNLSCTVFRKHGDVLPVIQFQPSTFPVALLMVVNTKTNFLFFFFINSDCQDRVNLSEMRLN